MYKFAHGKNENSSSDGIAIDDLDATHKKQSQEDQAFFLSRKVQKKMQPVMSILEVIKREELAKLDREFPNLIQDTNILAEQVKKLSTSKVPLKKRYEDAKHKVPLISLKPALDLIVEAENKKIFFAFEEALDNTAIIDAHPHEATLFKVGVLYKLFLDEDPPPRVIEMCTAIREANLPDSFKYIEEQTLLRKANYVEMAQQAYLKIINNCDEETQERFEVSYEQFKKIYLGLRRANLANVDILPIDEINFPEIQDTFLLQSRVDEKIQGETHTIELPKQSNRHYENFNGNELTTLQFLIPKHKKNSVFIPEIGGIALDTVMRACLSKQTSLVDESSDIRKRNAREKFILKVQSVLSKARAAMDGNKLDYDDGYSGQATDPQTIKGEVNKAFEVYQKQLIISKDCKLSGSELTHAFFESAINSLNHADETEQKKRREEYEKSKININFFDKRKLKFEYESNQKLTKDNHLQCITEMKNFKKIVERIDPKNMMIFAAEAGGKASFSVPKDTQINDDIAASFSAIASLAPR